ncbi:hypothetical protein IMY05_002G0062600 [Salix suchowensis]|nr:hypothetical protein IMY05_002G0062600 [Salix suchowensis]
MVRKDVKWLRIFSFFSRVGILEGTVEGFPSRFSHRFSHLDSGHHPSSFDKSSPLRYHVSMFCRQKGMVECPALST